MVPPRRRRNQNRFLDNVGRITPGTLAMFGIAVLLLIASAGIVATTVVRRSSASTAEAQPTAVTTPFVAIVETPFPTPITPTVATPRASASASPRTAASPATPTTGSARTATATISAAAVGSGQSKAARGLAGAMAAALGGSLPPAQTGSTGAPPTGPIVVPPVLPTPTAVSQPTATPTRVTTTGSTGGGTTGGGTTGGGTTGGGTTGGGTTGGGTTGGGTTGGGTTAPTATPTPRPPTATPVPTATATRPAPTATATATPTLPAVAFPGPGSATHSYAFAYTLGTDISDADTNAPYYIIQWQGFSQQQFAAVATGAGIDGAVQATADGFRASGAAGTLIYSNTSKQLIFTAADAGSALVAATPTVATPQASTTPRVGPAAASPTVPAQSAAPSAAPSPSVPPTTPPTTVPTVAPTPTTVQPIGKAAAIARAQEWLARANLLPGGHDGGTATQPTPNQYVVTFHPDPEFVGDLNVLGDPAVVVKLSSTGAVREVFYRWFSNPNPRITQLRGGEAAWADVAAGKAYLEVDQTVPVGSNTVYRGNATVTDVAVELREATAANGTVYLLPVYVFKGTVIISNPVLGQSGEIPFRLYVRAVP